MPKLTVPQGSNDSSPQAAPQRDALEWRLGIESKRMRAPPSDERIGVTVGKVLRLDQIADADRCMEENKAGGKIVVLA